MDFLQTPRGVINSAGPIQRIQHNDLSSSNIDICPNLLIGLSSGELGDRKKTVRSCRCSPASIASQAPACARGAIDKLEYLSIEAAAQAPREHIQRCRQLLDHP